MRHIDFFVFRVDYWRQLLFMRGPEDWSEFVLVNWARRKLVLETSLIASWLWDIYWSFILLVIMLWINILYFVGRILLDRYMRGPLLDIIVVLFLLHLVEDWILAVVFDPSLLRRECLESFHAGQLWGLLK